MLVSDVLRGKGHDVVKIHATDSVELAVRRLAEHRIGALIVEDRWMKPVGIFSERDFINAVARDGAAVLSLQACNIASRRTKAELRRHQACCRPIARSVAV